MSTGKQVAEMTRRKYLTSQLMPHEQRQALIRRPFPWVRYVERCTWAGVLIPTEKDFLDRVAAPRGRRVEPKPNMDTFRVNGHQDDSGNR